MWSDLDSWGNRKSARPSFELDSTCACTLLPGMLSMAFHSSAVALPKRRQIITIEEGQTGVRATCALVTSKKLDCSGKPNCRLRFALNDDKMWRVRPHGSAKSIQGNGASTMGSKPTHE